MATHVTVLPQGILDSLCAQIDASAPSKGLSFLRLPHPRTGIPSLYLPFEASQSRKSCIAELQTVAPPNERSWLISEGSVVENGKLLLMTPVDPAFLMVPILQATLPTDGGVGTFRAMDDLFESAIEQLIRSPPATPNPKDASSFLSKDSLERFVSLECARTAMKRVCEVKDITPEITVYRYSQERAVDIMKEKVTRLTTPEVFESSKTLIRHLAKDGLMDDGKEDLIVVGRLRAACDLLSQYLPSNVSNALLASYDFTTLTAHLKVLADEAAELAAIQMEKAHIKGKGKGKGKETKADKDKAANEKKRKSASHGVEVLKKANTRGMAKISSFFQPKAS